jgi:hypothetical protein
MTELIDTHPVVSVQESEFIRLLGYPRDHALEGRPRELAQWAMTWYRENGRPWIYGRRVSDLRIDNGRLSMDGMDFLPGRLVDQLADAQADGAFVLAVSAGKECEEAARQVWNENKPDEYFFLETYGSAVVEHLIASAAFRICEWADREHLAVLPHYSPGYPGWDISDQTKLMRVILGDRMSVFPGGLRVLETGMLNPRKSLLAVFGITSRLDKIGRLADLIPCQNCSLVSCQYRRVPYRNPLPRIENVRPIRPEDGSAKSNANELTPPSIGTPTYSFSPTALRKWSRERLRLNTTANGSVEARFRYEGTTCSNLGRPLDFTYIVKLDRTENEYTIVDAHCIPSPDDEGYKSMCEYIKKGGSFLKTITGENPMVGKSLDEAIRWKREYSPSGCFCEQASRQHKWGLVYEVLHFALAQGLGRGTEKQVRNDQNHEPASSKSKEKRT